VVLDLVVGVLIDASDVGGLGDAVLFGGRGADAPGEDLGRAMGGVEFSLCGCFGEDVLSVVASCFCAGEGGGDRGALVPPEEGVLSGIARVTGGGIARNGCELCLLGGSVAWLMLGNAMMFKMANFRF
jgi:hypothetical protein